MIDEIKIIDDILDSFLIASLQLAIVREPAFYQHLVSTETDYMKVIFSLMPRRPKLLYFGRLDLEVLVFDLSNLLQLKHEQLEMLGRVKKDSHIFKTTLLNILAENHRSDFVHIMLKFIETEDVFYRYARNVIRDGSDHLIEIMLRDLLEYHPEDCYLLFPDIPQDEKFASSAYLRILGDRAKFAYQYIEWFKAKRQLQGH